MRGILNLLVTMFYTLVAILYVMADDAVLTAIWSAGAGIWLVLTFKAFMED